MTNDIVAAEFKVVRRQTCAHFWTVELALTRLVQLYRREHH